MWAVQARSVAIMLGMKRDELRCWGAGLRQFLMPSRIGHDSFFFVTRGPPKPPGNHPNRATQELAEERTVAAVGENVARLAHGLKNTVHSLRGFVGLIEPRLTDARADRDALGGLRAAIDDLERLARLTLNPTAEKAHMGWRSKGFLRPQTTLSARRHDRRIRTCPKPSARLWRS